MRDSDLHAYVDGQLESARRIEVETWLAEDEEAARRVEAYRAQNAALHSLFDSVLREAADSRCVDLGERLGARLDVASASRRWWLQPGWQRMAAAVAFVTVGLGVGWLGRGQMVAVPLAQAPVAAPAAPTLQAFAEEATQAHSFYANSRFEVEMGADNQDALNNWLSERLGRAVFAPDLSAIGYRLIGGRSLPAEGGAVAQYMYETGGGTRLTLFVGTPKADQHAAFSFVKHGEIASFYWAEGVLTYALAGRFERDQLMTIAQAVHQKLKSGPAPRPTLPQSQGAPDAKQPPSPSEPMAPQPPTPGSDQERPKAS